VFKNKKANFEPKKENVAINMVLTIMTTSQAFKVDAFKEKETRRNKKTTNYQEE
jgi:hypothetical protein